MILTLRALNVFSSEVLPVKGCVRIPIGFVSVSQQKVKEYLSSHSAGTKRRLHLLKHVEGTYRAGRKDRSNGAVCGICRDEEVALHVDILVQKCSIVASTSVTTLTAAANESSTRVASGMRPK